MAAALGQNLRVAASILAGLALLAYGLARVGFGLFYDPVGVGPDELGFGYAQTLSEAAVGLAAMLVLGIVAVAVVGALVRLFRPKTFRDMYGSRPIRVIVSVILVLGIANGTIVHALQRRADFERGYAVRPVRTLFVIPNLPLRAEPVSVFWVTRQPPRTGINWGCLLYLGQSNGVAILYDHARGSTLRFPASDVVIASNGKQSCP